MAVSVTEMQLRVIAKNLASKDLKMVQKDLNNLAKITQQVGKKMKEVGRNMTTFISVPMAVVASGALKMAIDFESAFAGVRKTVDATEKEFAALEKGIREMAKTIPASTEVIAGVAEAAGQLGIQKENILDFTKVMIDLGNSTNLSAKEAATALARFANIMQMPQDQFDRLGAVIVDVGNKSATTEAEIVTMAMRLAGAGKTIGLTEAQVIGLAGALSSVGLRAEMGGTSFSRVMIEMNNAVAKGGNDLKRFALVAGLTSTDFAKTFKEDAGQALLVFTEGLDRLQKSGVNTAPIMDDLGFSGIRVQDALRRASGSGDLLRKTVDIGTEAWKANTALIEEATKRYKTMDSVLKVVWNNLKDISITLGQALIPFLERSLEALKPFIKTLEKGVVWFKNLDETAQNIFVGSGAVLALTGPALLALGMFVTTIAAIGAPVALAIVAFEALAVIGIAVYQNWGEVVETLKMLPQILNEVIKGIKNIAVDKIFIRIIGFVNTGINTITNKFNWLKNEVKKIFTDVVGVVKDMMKSGVNTIIETFEGLKLKVEKIFKDVVKVIKDMMKSVVETFTFSLPSISGSIEAIKNKFEWLKDKIVGHSVVPDMMNDIVKEFVKMKEKTGKQLDAHVKLWEKAMKKEFEETKKQRKKQEKLLDNFNQDFNRAIKTQYEVEKIELKKKYIDFASLVEKGLIKQKKLDEWLLAEKKKIKDEEILDAKKKEDDIVQKRIDNLDLAQQAVSGTAEIIKSIWNSSAKNFDDVWKTALDTFITNLFVVDKVGKSVSISMQANMAAATAGISLVVGALAMGAGSLFGGSKRIQKIPLAEKLREVFNEFIEKFRNTMDDFQFSIADPARKFEIVTERIKGFSTDVTEVLGVTTKKRLALIDIIKGFSTDAAERLRDSSTKDLSLFGLEKEMKDLVNLSNDIISDIRRRYDLEKEQIKKISGVITELKNSIIELKQRSQDWVLSFEEMITGVKRKGFTPEQMLAAFKEDVTGLEAALKETTDPEKRLKIMEQIAKTQMAVLNQTETIFGTGNIEEQTTLQKEVNDKQDELIKIQNAIKKETEGIPKTEMQQKLLDAQNELTTIQKGIKDQTILDEEDPVQKRILELNEEIAGFQSEVNKEAKAGKDQKRLQELVDEEKKLTKELSPLVTELDKLKKGEGEFAVEQANTIKILERMKESGLTEFDIMLDVQQKQLEAQQEQLDTLSGIKNATELLALVALKERTTGALTAIGTIGSGEEGAGEALNTLVDFSQWLTDHPLPELPKFQSGTDFVPQTGLAMVHQGEKIIPARANNQMSKETIININIQAWDGEDVTRVVKNKVIPILRDDINNYGVMRIAVNEAK